MMQKRLEFSSIDEKLKQELKKGEYRVKIAPSDLVVFDGYTSYDMRHQLFIQGKGTYTLLFDGGKGLHDPLPEYPQGNVTSALILKHWVDSILTCCGEDDDDIIPVILFVATHRDTLNQDELKRTIVKFQQGLKEMFQNHEPARRIKYNDIFFINGTDRNDSEVIRLQTTYVNIAFQQKSWGKRMPMAWVPLELQLSEMRSLNINIISKDDLIKINEENYDLALKNKELDDFLQVQHALGKIMYFKSQGLEHFIILQPNLLANILRSFITDEIFFPVDTTLRKILIEITKTGKIRKKDLFRLWEQDEFNQYMPGDNFKEFVVKLLIHLDCLVEPKRYNARGNVDVYLVPCIIKQEPPTNFCDSLEEKRTLYLSYKLLKSSIPSALSFKIIGSALNVWPLKETEDGCVCLYNKAAILRIDQSNELYILVKDNRVVVCLQNMVSRQFISPDIASCIQECLTLTIENALKFYHSSFGKLATTLEITNLFKIEVGEKCKVGICYLPMSEAHEVASWKCRNGQEHITKYPLYWTFDTEQQVCKPDCTGLDKDTFMFCPEDRHLARLALSIGISKFRDFVIILGLSKDDWEAIEYKHQGGNVNMMKIDAMCALRSDMYPASFQDLHDALTRIEYDCHILCQIFREDRTIYDIDHPLLQTVPDNDTLHELSTKIGNCAIRLGIELDVPYIEIEETTKRYSKDMFKQNQDIFMKWGNKYRKTTLTLRTLMHVLIAVDERGCKFLIKKYSIDY